jgi:uncharacterized tellurite resistance protein B-like protein
MSLWKALGFAGAGEPGSRDLPEGAASRAETDTVRRIASELKKMEAGRARFTAGFAYILSRVANADQDISEEETAAMERIVRQIGGLGEAQAALVVEMARTHAMLFGGTEDFLVTREFAKAATQEEKLSLLECLFAIGAADNSVSSEEESVIKQTASELGLGQADYIAVRRRFKDRLAVFKDLKL